MAYPTQKQINAQMGNLHKEYQETLFKFDEAKQKGNYVMANIYNKHLNQISTVLLLSLNPKKKI